MKLTAKLAAVLILFLLAAPIFLLNSCGDGSGSGFFTGGACGGCPNSTAPDGAFIQFNAANIDATWDATGAPSMTGCMSSISLIVRDKFGKAMDNICTEIFTEGWIAVPDPAVPGDCSSVLTYAHHYMRQRTNEFGVITVDYANIITKQTASTSSVGQFIQASSCNASKTLKGTWKVTW